MPGSYNRCIFVGNLTRDPEIRYIASGMGVTKFTIAINRRTKTGDETTFLDVVAWDKLAETCNTYLKKGASVLVEGRLVIRSYDDKDGVKRKATEVVIDSMQMLDRKEQNGGGNGGGYSSQNQGNSGGYQSSSYGGGYESGIEDEIPF